MSEREVVPIVYHFFPHYRAGVNRALACSKKYRFLFVGGASDGAGSNIEPWEVPKGMPFLRTRNVLLGGRVLFQSKVIQLAFHRNIKSIVFLGDAGFVTTWLAAAVARLSGKRVFFWTHGWTLPDRGLKRICRLAFYRLANGLLLYGHHAERIAVGMGLLRENLHVIYNSLDYSLQKAVRDAVSEEELSRVRESLFGAHANNPTLICAGRLLPMRRLDLLLEAMRLLKAEHRWTNLLLVGNGIEASELRLQAQQSGLIVRFFGACYDEPVLGRLFMASDMLVVPGRIGLAAIHSLTYGTPVLTHDDPTDQGPEWESIIPGFNGAHFAHNDSQDLARVLWKWFQRAPERNVIRHRCYEVIERFYNPATQASLIERVLEGKREEDSDWESFCAKRRNLAAKSGIGVASPSR